MLITPLTPCPTHAYYLNICQSYWLFFSRKPTLYCFCFSSYFIGFSPEFDYFLFSTSFACNFPSFFPPRAFWSAIKLLLWDLIIFFLKLRHLVLWTCLLELSSLCYKFRYVVYSFLFNSKIFLSSFIISDWTSFSFCSEFFSSRVFENFLLFLLMLISSSHQCWSNRMQSIILIFFYLFWLIFFLNIWSILEKDPYEGEKKIYSLLFG